MAFRIGQKVVCIDDAILDGRAWNGDAPQVGAIYTIKSYHRHDDCMVVWLEEITRAATAIERWGSVVGYGAYRFRPLVERKTDISIFTAMLTGPKVLVDH